MVNEESAVNNVEGNECGLFDILSGHFRGGSEENHDKLQPGYLVPGPRFEAKICTGNHPVNKRPLQYILLKIFYIIYVIYCNVIVTRRGVWIDNWIY
jgi:hypothetical protein